MAPASTLAYALSGRDGYTVTRGHILYRGRDLTAMAPEERAREGVSWPSNIRSKSRAS
jgi:Fe-S cluster assembly ATP-binding protein